MIDIRQPSQGIEIQALSKVFGPDERSMIKLVEKGISKQELKEQHQHVLGLRNINLSISGGAIQVIMGLSGSGKSTLIRHINRLVEPTMGEIIVDGVDITRMNARELRDFRRHQTAMVFQKFALLPHWNVLDNVVYGLEIRGVARGKQVEAAMRWIDRVGLTGFERNFPHQLSGGMQQRVGLARALTNDAPILLMDEAFSALDPLIRTDMQTVLLDIQKEIGKTIVFITHDLDEALRLGNNIAILRDGEVIQEGSSQDIVLRPVNDYVANFVRQVNRGRVLRVESVMSPNATGSDSAKTTIPCGTTVEDAIRKVADYPPGDIAVVEPDGRTLGTVNIQQLAQAVVSPTPV